MTNAYTHRRSLTLALALGSFALSATALGAQWEGTLGAGAIYAPDYLGSDDYEWTPFPAFEATYDDTLFVSMRNGIGWNVINRDGLKVAPFIGYTFGRDDTGDISRLDEVDGGATAGLRIGYQGNNWRYSGSIETPFTGDIDGYRLTAGATYVSRFSERTVMTFGPELAYISDKWTDALFSVSPYESARSGIAAYAADDGAFSVGANASLSYYLAPQWSVTGVVGVSKLTGDASDSPIVDDLGSDVQWRTGAFINYHF
ncbi:MAG: MipA/OmpV family protein [Halomonas sp.]|nr:MipA/OmpV family protein [Halomonas sp.]MBP5979908.1 MipA/OmpV family protein [Halomonas sp.]